MNTSEKQNWWSRNWKWFVPTGCLGLIILVLGFIASIMMIAFGVMKSSNVYEQAMIETRSNIEVIEALGEPIEDGFLLTGEINVHGTLGEANFAIKISGPKGEGTVYVIATKKAGRWNYELLEVEINGREKRINLLNPEQNELMEPITDCHTFPRKPQTAESPETCPV